MYYPIRYVDDLGSVDTIIFNNGQTLSMKIRDVLFRGCDFDSLEPEENYTKEDLKSFLSTSPLTQRKLVVSFLAFTLI